jgi:hypothetical protein
MANIANVKVKTGNVLSLSGSSAEITGSTTVAGDLSVQGTISASVLTISETIVSSSVVYHSGSTKFGDNAFGPGPVDTHQFTGSVSISGSTHSLVGSLSINGNVSGTTFTGSFAGDGSKLVNLDLGGSAVTAITGSTNINVSSTTGNVTASLAPSISVVNVTASNAVTASLGRFTTLSASSAEFSGSVIIYGTASLAANPTAAYVRYESSNDRIKIFPGLDVSGSSTVSGNLNVTGSMTASSFVGSAAGLTGLPLTGLSGAGEGKIIIGSGATFITSSLLAGPGIQINSGSGVVSITGSTGAITTVTSSDSNINITTNGPVVTASLNQDLNLNSVVVTGSMLVSGSFARTRVTLYNNDVTNYQVSSTDQVIIVKFNNSENDTVIMLPSAAEIDGRELIIKRGDQAYLDLKIQITPSGSETIDSDTSVEIWGPFESKTLIADSGSVPANWIIV